MAKLVRYLFDSDVVIALVRNQHEGLIARVEEALPHAALSTISVAELTFGVEKSTQPRRNREQLEMLLGLMQVISFETSDAEHAGTVRAELEKQGVRIGAHDMLIAGQARARGLVVVTGNTREFERVSGLRVENWLTPDEP